MLNEPVALSGLLYETYYILVRTLGKSEETETEIAKGMLIRDRYINLGGLTAAGVPVGLTRLIPGPQ